MTLTTLRTLLRTAGYAVLLLGCSCSDHDHDHGHGGGTGHDHGPVHGGELVELGEDFAFLEFLSEPESGQLTCWVHGAHVTPGLRLAQESITLRITTDGAPWELVLAAQADPLTGEKPGDSARFQGQDERLRGLRRFEAVVLSVAPKGTTFTDRAFTYDPSDAP